MKTKNRIWLSYLMGLVSVLMIVYNCRKNEEPINKITDIDGNTYDTVTIGTQVWMKGNLKTSRFSDNTTIPLITDNSEWAALSTPGYCWYENNAAANKGTYGALYNWYAVSTGKLCPEGWHIPSYNEWTVLLNYLGGDVAACGKLKEKGTAHWQTPDPIASNSSGFTGLPAGARAPDGSYYGARAIGIWWTATDYPDLPRLAGIVRYIIETENDVLEWAYTYNHGLSVRCMMDHQ